MLSYMLGWRWNSDILTIFEGNSFVWDVYDAIFFQSAGLVVHGVACLAIFAFSFVSHALSHRFMIRADPGVESLATILAIIRANLPSMGVIHPYAELEVVLRESTGADSTQYNLELQLTNLRFIGKTRRDEKLSQNQLGQ
jgi:hypothetical protein